MLQGSVTEHHIAKFTGDDCVSRAVNCSGERLALLQYTYIHRGRGKLAAKVSWIPDSQSPSHTAAWATSLSLAACYLHLLHTPNTPPPTPCTHPIHPLPPPAHTQYTPSHLLHTQPQCPSTSCRPVEMEVSVGGTEWPAQPRPLAACHSPQVYSSMPLMNQGAASTFR